jgi:hypothetical protein
LAVGLINIPMGVNPIGGIAILNQGNLCILSILSNLSIIERTRRIEGF